MPSSPHASSLPPLPFLLPLQLHYYYEAARALESKGMLPGNGRLRFLVEEGAGHHELAWQWRLTGALQFLLGPWKA